MKLTFAIVGALALCVLVLANPNVEATGSSDAVMPVHDVSDQASTPSPAVNADADAGVTPEQFVGVWSGDCGIDVQCNLAISEAEQGNYLLLLTVSHFSDNSKIECKVEGAMKDGGGGMLAGPMGSSLLAGAFKRGLYAIELHGLKGDECDGRYNLETGYRLRGE